MLSRSILSQGSNQGCPGKEALKKKNLSQASSRFAKFFSEQSEKALGLSMFRVAYCEVGSCGSREARPSLIYTLSELWAFTSA